MGCRPRVARLLALLSLPLLAAGQRMDDGSWVAGGYSYSDELGGFRIVSANGVGTRADPVVLVEQLHAPGPATLVIRAARTIRPFGPDGDFANGFITMELRIVNASGLGWVGFDFELQEEKGMASLYGDGLSFDQRLTDSATTLSSAFRRFEQQFEPGDRLLFSGGAVDPEKEATFRFLITDFTPVPIFYLVQEPRIPFS
jgi:hypothetical protein